MSRVLRIVALILVIQSVAVVARATAPKGKNFTIGVVQITDAFVYADAVASFRKDLEELGYARSDNLTVLRRVVLGDTKGLWDKFEIYQALKGYISEFKERQVDLVVTVGTPATLHGAPLAREAGLPVIFIAVADPDAIPFIKEGWITGSTNFTDPEKLLRLLKNTLPGVEKLGMWVSTDANARRYHDLVQTSAKKLGFKCISVDVDTDKDVDKVVDAFRQNRPDILLVLPDTWIGRDDSANGKVLVQRLIREEKILTATYVTDVFDNFPNALAISAGVSFARTGSMGAALADQVLNGADPGELPVAHPKGPEFRMRLDVIEWAGVKFTPELLRFSRMVGN